METNFRSFILLRKLLNWNKFQCNEVRSHSTVDLAHRIYGEASGVPIIVIHGLLGSKNNWRSMSQKMSSTLNRGVVAVDLRNHGDSPGTDSHTYPELAADVVQLMTKLQINQATLIGHSMGGRTAMIVALTQPEKVNGLVIVDISPTFHRSLDTDFFTNIFEVMSSITFTTTDIIKAKAEAREKLKPLIKDEGVMQLVLMNLQRKENIITWKCNPGVLRKYFREIASFPSDMDGKTYSGPVLFIGGSRSAFIPRDDLSNIKKFFPNANLEYVDSGHLPYYEQPDEFLKLVSKFLNQ